MTPLDRLQGTLRRLFRLDEPADLDFGIHRVIGLKRKGLEQYLETDLAAQVETIMERSRDAVTEAKQTGLEAAKKRVIEDLGKDALTADGTLAEDAYAKTPAGKEYVRAQGEALNLKSADDMREEIFDHIANFFARYDCGGGDIVPRRRHSIRGRYAVPHNGEEVLLHWANRDQYYIKTTAYHPTIAFRVHDKRYQFKITESLDIPRDNNQDGRFLIPDISNIKADASGEITVPFTFCALDKTEKDRYTALSANGDNGNGSKVQRGILTDAFAQLQKAAAKKTDLRPLLGPRDGSEDSVFMYHAHRFVRRNNADFFIHRHLRRFLNEELDFYLKSEVLNTEELVGLSGLAVSARMVAFHAVRDIAKDIADRLAEWENLQKTLWEKKKFILQTEYCATLGHIPDAEKSGLLQEIAKCNKQWTEWKTLGIGSENFDLFSGKGKSEKRIAYLRENPSLPIDTANFPPEFKDRLLAQFSNIDDVTDGVLIHGENWQTLNLIQEKYRGRVKCVYIDPPYNAPASEVLYMNDFKHSCWLSFMYDRILVGMPLMSSSAVMSVAIDDYEFVRLSMLLGQALTSYEAYAAIVKHHGAGGAGTNLSRVHEYNIFLVPEGQDILKGKTREGEESRAFTRTGTAKSNFRIGRPNSFYALLVDPKTSMVVGAEKPPEIGQSYPTEDTVCGLNRVYPIIGDGSERVWRRSYEKVLPLIDARELSQRGRTIYHGLEHNGSREPLYSIWDSTKFNAGSHGTNLLRNIFGTADVFAYSKSIHTVQVAIDSMTHDDTSDCMILDYFAGSGTTAHAVISLNREDGERRKFILAEAGEHFNTAVLPRIKKIIYAPEWRNGKPLSVAAGEALDWGPRLVKYQRIESYEDTLANIRFTGPQPDDPGQERLWENLSTVTPRYELEWESRNCPTRLSEAGLDSPFSYTLELFGHNAENDEQTHTETADLPETFAYLIGLRVRTQQVAWDGKRRYVIQHGHTRDGETVVIWRDTADWKAKDYDRDREFIKKSDFAAGADKIWLNGDTTLEGGESLNPIFSAAMFATNEGDESE